MASVSFLQLKLSCLCLQCQHGVHYHDVSYLPLILQLRQCATQFGAQVEAILSKYGKGILRKYICVCYMHVYLLCNVLTDEQFILRRLSEAAIDTYGMAVTLSRQMAVVQMTPVNELCTSLLTGLLGQSTKTLRQQNMKEF